jgi:hypothetical protein
MSCAACRHFVDAPAAIEAGLPGLSALASGHAASRADDGYCAHHDRYVPAAAGCAAFAPMLSFGESP